MSFNDLMNKFGGYNISEPFELPPEGKAGNLDSFINRFGYAGMTESYWFYDHTIELRFNVDEHKYYLIDPNLGNMKERNGVTNTVHIINASEMLIPWAAKVTVAKALRLMPTEMVDGTLRVKPITFDEFTTLMLEAKSAHKDKLEEAGDIGHMAHKCLEDSINYAIINDPEHIVRNLIKYPEDERAVNAANGAKNWMDQHNVRWIETETKIYSREHEYAGTMDGLAKCDSCQDRACCPEEFKDRLSLIDWKSSNYLKIEYLFQTASYQHAKQEEFGLNIVDRWILRLGKNEEEAGKFEPWHMGPSDFEDDFAGFLACLRLTRLVHSVNERMKTQKKWIKGRKKEQKEAAKLIAKEQEKLQKALEKAETKRLKEIEKAKTKEEAKLKREADKAAKKLGKLMPVTTAIVAMLNVDIGQEEECTSSEIEALKKKRSMMLDTTPPVGNGTSKNCSQPQTIKELKDSQENLSITSTVATKVLQISNIRYEEEPAFKPIALPGEK